jgi:ATP-dependent helicase/nuclease subunit A
MSKKHTAPADQDVRDRIAREFGRNFLVEAGAGSGKTHSLAMRMAAGIATGEFFVEGMAAVTFTRKAAAELRGRFQLALETRLANGPRAEERARLEAALAGIERLFAGTIHAFCAHLLRERPVDAGVAPGFVELEDVEDARERRRAWRAYVGDARARGDGAMLALLDAGVTPKDLDAAFARVCENEDVEFDRGRGDAPLLEPALTATERLLAGLETVKPEPIADECKCKLQPRLVEFTNRLRSAKRSKDIGQLGRLIAAIDSAGFTKKWWGPDGGGTSAGADRAKALVDEYQSTTGQPFVAAWRAYLHRLAMAVLLDARDAYARDRRRLNVVNYVDLLRVTSRMLREHADVRLALQQKYRWLFIDEFQDTDPIQAEIFLMLAAAETGPGPVSGKRGPGPLSASRKGGLAPLFAPGGNPPPAPDPFALPLRPGALFVVGDPKQSIYRFRRADIEIYDRVARRITECGGEVLSLSANFRSLPAVCDVANTVFPPLFGNVATPQSPAFVPLRPVREDDRVTPGPRVAKLTVAIPPGRVSAEMKSDAATAEAAQIAAFIRSEVDAGRRRFGDFLVLTRQKTHLGIYADAFDELEIPVEISGAGMFCTSEAVRTLALLLSALADPLDSVSLVGVLRGPLFGLSDPDLFTFRQAGGRFELNVPLPEAPDAKTAKALDAAFGPALAAMRALREMRRLTRRLPLPAALDAILETSGWLALAGTTPGGAMAGHVLQAIDEVRQVVESGGGLVDAAAVLLDEEASTEAEALPLEPGRRDVVRLMNLHKAKGLEAKVVFLADPMSTYDFPVELRVERTNAGTVGHLTIVRKSDTSFVSQTIAEPLDWDHHEREEKRFLDAERTRLRYVAGTRAEDLLVVGRVSDASKNKAWDVFESCLLNVPELDVPTVRVTPTDVAPDFSRAGWADANAAASAARDARRAVLRAPSWDVGAPSGEKARLTAATRASAVNGEAAELTAAPTQRVDAGVAWGSLLHGLLEHAMHFQDATRDDLARLAQWLTVETDDLRPFIPEALDWVDEVRRLPFWTDATASAERHVEVPFAVSVSGVAPGFSPAIHVLHGIIDLVHRADGGWRVLDYKSDQLDALPAIDAVLLSRYAPQLAQYRRAWQLASGEAVVSTDLVALRAKRTIHFHSDQRG